MKIIYLRRCDRQSHIAKGDGTGRGRGKKGRIFGSLCGCLFKEKRVKDVTTGNPENCSCRMCMKVLDANKMKWS